MTAGRKPKKAPEIIDAETAIDPPRVANAMVAMQQDGQSAQRDAIAEAFALGADIGVVRMARITKGISAAAEIKAFERICESKGFKNIPIPDGSGGFCLADNVDEFCRAMFGGLGYKAMNNRKVMLEELGEETFNSAMQIGLSRSQLRLLIHLPEDSRAAVENAMQSSDKSEVVGLIQSLANQLDESKAKEEELKGTIQANEKLLAYKSKQLDEAALVKTLPADEAQAVILTEASTHLNAALAVVQGRFRQALLALVELDQRESGVKDFRPLATGLVGQLQQAVTVLRDELLLTDIVDGAMPEWMRATAHLDDDDALAGA